MVYFTPLYFNVEETSESKIEPETHFEPSPVSYRTRIAYRRRRRSITTDWFIKKTLEDTFELLDPRVINEELQKIIHDKYEKVEKIDPEIYSHLVDNSRIMMNVPSFYLTKEVIASLSEDSGLLMLLMNTPKNLKNICGIIEEKAREISKITSDLGVKFGGCVYKKEYARLIISQKSEIIRAEDFKNEFEKKVYDEIKENITDSILSNFTLNFPVSSETYEYDTVVCLGSNKIYQISCKDYSQVKTEADEESSNLRNKVIFQPKDKADLISAECFIVLKGFNKNLLTQFKAFGRARGVTILDDSEYLDVIKKHITKSTLEGLFFE